MNHTRVFFYLFSSTSCAYFSLFTSSIFFFVFVGEWGERVKPGLSIEPRE